MKQKTPKIHPAKPKINWRASINQLKAKVKAYNETEGRTRKEKIKNSHLQTLIHIYQDFFKNFEKGKTRHGAFCLTTSLISLKTESTQTDRTSYNHIEKFRDKAIGLIKRKLRTVADFGKGTVNCIELMLDVSIVLFWQENINQLMVFSVDNPVDSFLEDKKSKKSDGPPGPFKSS